MRSRVEDACFDNAPVAMPMEVLLGKTPRLTRVTAHVAKTPPAFTTAHIDLAVAIDRVWLEPK